MQKKIALEKINGEIIKLELDCYGDDGPEYEIEILSDGVKYEIEIDAYTGKIREFERDDDDFDDDDYKNKTTPKLQSQPAKSLTLK